jgi:hypothetical protein
MTVSVAARTGVRLIAVMTENDSSERPRQEADRIGRECRKRTGDGRECRKEERRKYERSGDAIQTEIIPFQRGADQGRDDQAGNRWALASMPPGLVCWHACFPIPSASSVQEFVHSALGRPAGTVQSGTPPARVGDRIERCPTRARFASIRKHGGNPKTSGFGENRNFDFPSPAAVRNARTRALPSERYRIRA